MRNLCASLLIGATVLLSGCNTTPYDRATIYYDRTQFTTQVSKDFPDIKGPILQHGRCSLLISTPGSTTGTYHFCTFALTQDELYVQGWDATALKYKEILRVDLSTLSKVALDSYFRTNQVQLIEQRRQSALSVMIDDGGYHDTAATERVYETIKKRGVTVVKSEGMMMPPAPPTPVVIPIIVPR
ncbi:hypothetical protein [Pseudomonas chlororaphis]|uniref:hypothetical protein n=1 Tax=Pseudomonas chlororaphis TaxID=587753 RepID=UPI0018E959DB|nr:hypothetical protein [Pseudomonas chlororaphis]